MSEEQFSTKKDQPASPEENLIPEEAMNQAQDQEALTGIFRLLEQQTGQNFAAYRRSTVERRLERRMAVNQVESFEAYARFLEENPLELELLFKALLIGVTGFFRDEAAFAVLEEKALPALFSDRSGADPVRIWTPGCATGEEAYSLAILCQEQREADRRPPPVHIFATDIDQQAIAQARTGLYPATIAADVSPERLQRFFDRVETGYRIRPSIREMVVFAVQSVTHDPPFSKLALISCRNVLIYLQNEWQEKVIHLCHYALEPGGFLWLGGSESLGRQTDLFETVDREGKLFRRREEETARPSFLALSRGAGVQEKSGRPSDDGSESGPEAVSSPVYLQAAGQMGDSSNTALQAANEELLCANEKLETTQEELRMITEEVTRANAALQDEVETMRRAAVDMDNLLTGLEVEAVFLDLELRISRFTPAAAQSIGLSETDIGRPVDQIAWDGIGAEAAAQARRVLKTLAEAVQETQLESGAWYRLRFRPYRTAQNAVVGLVMILVEITSQKESQARLRYLTQAADQSATMIAVVDESGRFEYVNSAFSRMAGYTPTELIGRTAALLDADQERPGLARRIETVLTSLTAWQGDFFYTKRNGENGRAKAAIAPAPDEAGRAPHLVITAEVVTGPEEADLLPALTQIVTEAAGFEAALPAVLALVCQENGWTFGEAWLPNAAQTRLEPGPDSYCREERREALAPFQRAAESFDFPPQTGLPGRVWASKETVWIPDLSLIPATAGHPRLEQAGRAGLKSAAGAPLPAGDRVLGLLIFYSDTRRPREENGAVLATAAAQLGRLLQHSRTEAALRRREALLQSIDSGTHAALTVVDVTGAGEFVAAGIDPALEQKSERSAGALVGRRLTGLEPPLAPKIKAQLEENYRRCLETGGPAEQEVMTIRRGEREWRLLRSEPLKDQAGQVTRIVTTILPITPNKQAETALHRAIALLEGLSEWHRLLDKATDQAEILDEMCRVVIEVAGYHAVWIGFAEEAGPRRVRPEAHLCFEREDLEQLDITWDEEEDTSYPTGRAIRTGETVVIHDLERREAYRLWWENAVKYGYRAMTAIPLQIGERVLGALSVYAAEPDAFNAKEIEILQKLTNDLTYGLELLAERNRAGDSGN